MMLQRYEYFSIYKVEYLTNLVEKNDKRCVRLRDAPFIVIIEGK